LVSFPVEGQETTRLRYKATHITKPPIIDGLITDDAWNEGSWNEDFTQYEPYNNIRVSQRTSFKILFDDDNLYVAIRAFDTSPDSIVTRITRRDQADGDMVAIVFDSYHDLRTAFLFGVSSAGVKYDQFYSNDGQNQDQTWDPNWWVKTSVNKEGWVAEMKIPFSQVRFEKNSGVVWGLEIARIIYRKNETDFWQHIPKDAPGLVHLFGELEGLENIKPRKIFDITPYTVAKTQNYMPTPSNPFLNSGKSHDLNGGLDAKIGVTNNMTMDLTINPDFGQVEADPSVVNLSAYETFFKEQRPFFIEGNNITDFNLGIGNGGVGNDNLFYSRRIGRVPQGSLNLPNSNWQYEEPQFTSIIAAAKLTGKTQNGLSVGFLDALTSEEKAKIDTVGGRISLPVEPLTNYFVGRVQKDYNSGNTIIGAIFTSTNRVLDSTLATQLHKSAYTGGIDFTQYFKNKSWMFNVNSAFSFVQGTKEAIAITQESSAHYFQRPDNNYAKLDTNRTSLLGSGGRMEILKMDGHWNFMGAMLWKSPEFETNDLGYLRQADQLLSVLWAGYNQWEPKGIYKKYTINFDIYNVFDFGGDWLAKGLEFNANMTFKNYWNASLYGSLTSNQLSTSLLRGGPMMKIPGSYSSQGSISTDNRKKVVLNINGGMNAQFQNVSFTTFLNFEADFKPTNYLLFSLSPQISTTHDQFQYITSTSYNSEPRYIFATIQQSTIGFSFRMNINISPDLTLQYWGQPFIASGKYSDYKYITNPMSNNLSDRYHVFTANQISGNTDGYNIDENNDGIPDYHISWNDFNYQAFLSNLVIRWEYNPGSSLYLVWSQNRTNQTLIGMMDYFNDIGSLFGVRPTNVFLVKLSYRFGLK
jgi:Domain of unknown function (DUF5916)/Carbohydrate family 9 binding domain-like